MYLARISDRIPIAQYWNDYPQKHPDKAKGKDDPAYYGDNIYKPDDASSLGFKRVESCFHCKESDLPHDVGGKNVIICKEFYYFSAENALKIPDEIRCDFNTVQRGYKRFQGEERINRFVDFVRNRKGECRFYRTLTQIINQKNQSEI